MAGVNFAFSLCLTPEHWYLSERSLYPQMVPQFLWLPPMRGLQITWLYQPVGFTLAGLTSLYRTEKAFLTSYHSQGKARRQKTEEANLSFCKRGLLAYLHSCSLRSRFLLNIHLRASYNPLQRPQIVGTIFALSLCCAPGHSISREKLAVHTSRTPVFNLVVSIFMAATQQLPPNCLSLGASGVFLFLGPMGW